MVYMAFNDFPYAMKVFMIIGRMEQVGKPTFGHDIINKTEGIISLRDVQTALDELLKFKYICGGNDKFNSWDYEGRSGKSLSFRVGMKAKPFAYSSAMGNLFIPSDRL